MRLEASCIRIKPIVVLYTTAIFTTVTLCCNLSKLCSKHINNIVAKAHQRLYRCFISISIFSNIITCADGIGESRCGVFAGKTVRSTPKRLLEPRAEVLTMRRYTNLRLPLPIAISGVCLYACFFSHDNSKTNDPKVFKLCTGNDPELVMGWIHSWVGLGQIFF